MKSQSKPLIFVDAFAGCGGLSLGLMNAGLQGLFAIEQDPFAFSTLRTNLIGNKKTPTFEWPAWLPKEAISVETLISGYESELRGLRGTVDVLAGGPPCQGFSTAGRRRSNDPRNRLFKSYVELVGLIEPKIVLMENVRGFIVNFGGDSSINNYAQELRGLLEKRYSVHERLLNLSQFGVPQQRTRYFLIALHPDFGDADPFKLVEEQLPGFLRRLNLQVPVSSWAAISDLEAEVGGTRLSRDTTGFLEIRPASKRTAYQRLMGPENPNMSDLRLARHAPEIQKRFRKIISTCHAEGRLNTTISTEMRDRYGLKKQALRVLDPDRPAPTITSMPDDLLHYKEARTLTVRENARLQSFPDWFAFQGKYTTGGERRRREVPRFTQVANAVPPLAARAIGEALASIVANATKTSKTRKPRLFDCGEGSMKVPELLS
ncbi:DNA cytosine methyltransferase [Methylocystis sp.]|uniref:DNA cytosine methyltransferase n=1 Tax=Methylocystis sp. TaxID=1911079 RepID=UPI003DA610F4